MHWIETSRRRQAREAKRVSARSFKLWAGIPTRSRLSQGLVEFLEEGDFELDTGPICGSGRATPIAEDRLVNLYGVPYEAQQSIWEMQREVVQEEPCGRPHPVAEQGPLRRRTASSCGAVSR